MFAATPEPNCISHYSQHQTGQSRSCLILDLTYKNTLRVFTGLLSANAQYGHEDPRKKNIYFKHNPKTILSIKFLVPEAPTRLDFTASKVVELI